MVRLCAYIVSWLFWTRAIYHAFPDRGRPRWLLLDLSLTCAITLSVGLTDLVRDPWRARLFMGGCLSLVLYVVVAVFFAVAPLS